MIKSFMEFLVTGLVVIVSYFVYFTVASILTFLLGLPIAIGIKVILDFMEIIFTNSTILVQ